jgi:hypothetical protein
MFRQKYADKLEEEPVTVAIGEDENFQLRPMDPQSRPRKQEIVEVVSLMKTTKDWQNIIPFLAGLRISRRFLNQGRWEWLIRRAGEANALGIILECAKQSERTGLRLREVDVVQKLFFALHQKAQAADFKGPANTKALSLAQQAVMLMQDPKHINHKLELNPMRRPFLIGVLLELSAANVLYEFEDRDESGRVHAYAERLMATWPLGAFDAKTRDWVHIDRMLQENVPIWNGIRLALQVNGIASNRALSVPLRIHLEELGALITKQRRLASEEVRQRPTLGYKQSQLMYQNEN